MTEDWPSSTDTMHISENLPFLGRYNDISYYYYYYKKFLNGSQRKED